MNVSPHTGNGETMDLTTMQNLVNTMNTLFPKADDVAWVTQPVYDELKHACVAAQKGDLRPSLDATMEFAGVCIFVDDTMAERCIETGTYVVKDGVVHKEVHKRYWV